MTEPTKYTLSNGKTIEIKRVSIFTLQLATKNIKPPAPPTQLIDGVAEPNFAHPDFLEALTEHQAAETSARVDAIYACGIAMPTDDEWKGEVAEFRAFAKAMDWDAPPANDWLCYIKHCLLITQRDFMDVQALIMAGSLPTEEVISQAADDFKSPVATPTDSEGIRATFGRNGGEPGIRVADGG